MDHFTALEVGRGVTATNAIAVIMLVIGRVLIGCQNPPKASEIIALRLVPYQRRVLKRRGHVVGEIGVQIPIELDRAPQELSVREDYTAMLTNLRVQILDELLKRRTRFNHATVYMCVEQCALLVLHASAFLAARFAGVE